MGEDRKEVDPQGWERDVARYKTKIDNYAKKALKQSQELPATTEKWAHVLEDDVLKPEFERGLFESEAGKHALRALIQHALVKNFLPKERVMGDAMLVADESGVKQVDEVDHYRALRGVEKFVKKCGKNQKFPDNGEAWLNLIVSSVKPKYIKWAYPSDALPKLANDACRWYLNGMSPIDEPPNVNVHNKKMSGFAKHPDIPTYEGPPPPDFDAVLREQPISMEEFVSLQITDFHGERNLAWIVCRCGVPVCPLGSLSYRHVTTLDDGLEVTKVYVSTGVAKNFNKDHVPAMPYANRQGHNDCVCKCGLRVASLFLDQARKPVWYFRDSDVRWRIGGHLFKFSTRELLETNDKHISFSLQKRIAQKQLKSLDSDFVPWQKNDKVDVKESAREADFLEEIEIKPRSEKLAGAADELNSDEDMDAPIKPDKKSRKSKDAKKKKSKHVKADDAADPVQAPKEREKSVAASRSSKEKRATSLDDGASALLESAADGSPASSDSSSPPKKPAPERGHASELVLKPAADAPSPKSGFLPPPARKHVPGPQLDVLNDSSPPKKPVPEPESKWESELVLKPASDSDQSSRSESSSNSKRKSLSRQRLRKAQRSLPNVESSDPYEPLKALKSPSDNCVPLDIGNDDFGDQEPTQWSCHVCTFLNPPAFLACEMCGSIKETNEVSPLAADMQDVGLFDAVPDVEVSPSAFDRDGLPDEEEDVPPKVILDDLDETSSSRSQSPPVILKPVKSSELAALLAEPPLDLGRPRSRSNSQNSSNPLLDDLLTFGSKSPRPGYADPSASPLDLIGLPGQKKPDPFSDIFPDAKAFRAASEPDFFDDLFPSSPLQSPKANSKANEQVYSRSTNSPLQHPEDEVKVPDFDHEDEHVPPPPPSSSSHYSGSGSLSSPSSALSKGGLFGSLNPANRITPRLQYQSLDIGDNDSVGSFDPLLPSPRSSGARGERPLGTPPFVRSPSDASSTADLPKLTPLRTSSPLASSPSAGADLDSAFLVPSVPASSPCSDVKSSSKESKFSRRSDSNSSSSSRASKRALRNGRSGTNALGDDSSLDVDDLNNDFAALNLKPASRASKPAEISAASQSTHSKASTPKDSDTSARPLSREELVAWRRSLRIFDRVDYRSAANSQAKGKWVPCVVTHMRPHKEFGFDLELLFQGFKHIFEWVPMSSGRLEPFGSRRAEYVENPPELQDEAFARSAYADDGAHLSPEQTNSREDSSSPRAVTSKPSAAECAPSSSPVRSLRASKRDAVSPPATVAKGLTSHPSLNISSLAMSSPARSIASDRAVLGSPLSTTSSVNAEDDVASPRSSSPRIKDDVSRSRSSSPRVKDDVSHSSSSSPRVRTSALTQSKTSRNDRRKFSLATEERASKVAPSPRSVVSSSGSEFATEQRGLKPAPSPRSVVSFSGSETDSVVSKASDMPKKPCAVSLAVSDDPVMARAAKMAAKALERAGGADALFGSSDDKNAKKKSQASYFDVPSKATRSRKKKLRGLKGDRAVPLMNRINDLVPKDFRGRDSSWGTEVGPLKSLRGGFKEAETLRKLYLYEIEIEPKANFRKMHPTRSNFGFLLERKVNNFPDLAVYLKTREPSHMIQYFDAVAHFWPAQRLQLTTTDIDKLKLAHTLLYKKFQKGDEHPNHLMNTAFAMFLVVPITARRDDAHADIDWRMVKKCCETMLSPNMKRNFLDFLTSSREDFDKSEIILETVYDVEQQQYYTVSDIHSDRTPTAAICDHPDCESDQTWSEFALSEYGKELRANQPIVEGFKFHPQTCSVFERASVKSERNPKTLTLVPELCNVYVLPKRLILNMPDIVSLMWGLQNAVAVVGLHQKLPSSEDIDISLLMQALTPKSSNDKINYELLEFFGDGMLKYLASDYLVMKHPTDSEGQLTQKRSGEVQNATLVNYFENHSLETHMILSKFLRKDYIPPCFKLSKHQSSQMLIPEISGKVRADLVEAMLGVAQISSGFHGTLAMLKWFGAGIQRLPLSHDRIDPNFPTRPEIQTLEERLGYTFAYKAYAYEALAMQASSSDCYGTPHWERMEFLGDAVIDALVTRRLFYSMPDSDPGTLTVARMEVVCNDSFAISCEKIGLFDILIQPSAKVKGDIAAFRRAFAGHRERTLNEQLLPWMSSAEADAEKQQKANKNRSKNLRKRIPAYNSEVHKELYGADLEAMKEEESGDANNPNFKEKRDVYPKCFGDLFEALVGAVYVDSNRNLETVWNVFRPFIALPFDIEKQSVAMDCEMVGVGREGRYSALARASLVDYRGKTIYDKFVKVREEVVDYRTFKSGIRAEDLVDAEDFSIVQKEVAELIDGKILVGHQIHSDLETLFLKHPPRLVRDTAFFRGLCPGNPVNLGDLCATYLGEKIQDGEHSSEEDALYTMRLYKKFMARTLLDKDDDLSDLREFK